MRASNNFTTRRNRLRTSLLQLLVDSLEGMTSYELTCNLSPIDRHEEVIVVADQDMRCA